MCVYLYIHNKYTQYIHIVCKQTYILNAINGFAALIMYAKKKKLNELLYCFTIVSYIW